jgi:crotonobetainyl-CoA:carnitine CoA-transferase CaiB-like acyl-CoA transferase
MDSNSPSGPLVGLRVIELGSTVAGPFCARLLADFGADVIKVEQASGDAVRAMGRQRDGHSLYGASILRGKRIVSIDLRQDDGRELVRKLCTNADIVVENFKAGALEKWDLSYAALSKNNPGLVLVRISGFGQDGPYSERGGYGIVCEAVSGLREITGEPDQPPPRVATPLTDYIAGLYGAFGAMMAIVERQQTGLGQIVDSALYEGSFSFMESHVPAFQQLGEVATRAGSRLPGNTPNDLYACADGRHIVIAAASDSVYRRLATAMGQPELADDPRFATALARIEHQDACEAAVSEWAACLSADEAIAALQSYQVPASAIFTVADIFADPHYAARDMLLEVPHEQLGSVTMTGVVPKLSRTPGAVRWSGRRIGADTRAVLRDDLGMSDAEIDALIASRTVHS